MSNIFSLRHAPNFTCRQIGLLKLHVEWANFCFLKILNTEYLWSAMLLFTRKFTHQDICAKDMLAAKTHTCYILTQHLSVIMTNYILCSSFNKSKYTMNDKSTKWELLKIDIEFPGIMACFQTIQKIYFNDVANYSK